MKYNWNERKLEKLLEKDEKLNNKKYSDGLQLEINSLRLALNIIIFIQRHTFFILHPNS